MSDNELLIAWESVKFWSWQLPDITDMDKPPYLAEYKYSEDGYGLIGALQHDDQRQLVIRVPHDGYFTTFVDVSYPDDPIWEERKEEGQKFIVWHRVVPVQVTRYIWKTEE